MKTTSTARNFALFGSGLVVVNGFSAARRRCFVRCRLVPLMAIAVDHRKAAMSTVAS